MSTTFHSAEGEAVAASTVSAVIDDNDVTAPDDPKMTCISSTAGAVVQRAEVLPASRASVVGDDDCNDNDNEDEDEDDFTLPEENMDPNTMAATLLDDGSSSSSIPHEIEIDDDDDDDDEPVPAARSYIQLLFDCVQKTVITVIVGANTENMLEDEDSDDDDMEEESGRAELEESYTLTSELSNNDADDEEDVRTATHRRKKSSIDRRIAVSDSPGNDSGDGSANDGSNPQQNHPTANATSIVVMDCASLFWDTTSSDNEASIIGSLTSVEEDNTTYLALLDESVLLSSPYDYDDEHQSNSSGCSPRLLLCPIHTVFSNSKVVPPSSAAVAAKGYCNDGSTTTSNTRNLAGMVVDGSSTSSSSGTTATRHPAHRRHHHHKARKTLAHNNKKKYRKAGGSGSAKKKIHKRLVTASEKNRPKVGYLALDK